MRVAVTGAAGFIGRHVVKVLAEFPVQVVVVVRRPHEEFHEFENVEMLIMDISSADNNCYDLMGRPDVLIHLAWDGLPNYKSLHHFEVELPLHYSFLKKMILGGLPALFAAGTCFEYGMQSGELGANLKTYPANPYGFAKDVLRKQLQYLQGEVFYKLNWGRIFYTYGEGQAQSSLYAQISKAVMDGKKTFNLSGGEQIRDYLSIEQLAEKIALCAISGRNDGAINICSGKPLTVRSLVEGWVRDRGWQIKLNFGHYPYPDYEPMEFWGGNEILDCSNFERK